MPATNVTVISVALARIYFAVLLAHLKAELNKPEAERNIAIRYGEIVARARADHAEAPYVEAANPRNIGTRLLVVQLICDKLGLPNLACLGVNATGEPGVAYNAVRDWEADKASVLAFDWDRLGADIAHALDLEATQATQRAVKKQIKVISEDEARVALYQASRENPGRYKVDYAGREAMIKQLRKGMSVDQAYALAAGQATPP